MEKNPCWLEKASNFHWFKIKTIFCTSCVQKNIKGAADTTTVCYVKTSIEYEMIF